MYDKPRDWELEFKNFIKTPPRLQILDIRPKSLPLNNNEARTILNLLKDGKISHSCFIDLKKELCMRKAWHCNKHDITGWNKFFLHETMKLANKQSINPQNNDFSNNQCHNFDDNDRLGL